MCTSIRRYPLAWYYVISVAIVIAVIPLFVFNGADRAVEEGFDAAGVPFNTDLVTWARVVIANPAAWFGALLAVTQVASPDIAVAIVVLIGFGLQGRLDLKERFRFWSKEIAPSRGIAWWCACVSVFSAMSLVTAGLSASVLAVDGFEWKPDIVSWRFVAGFLIAMFLDGGAVFEENGWRGFALPRLLKRYGPLSASVVLGLMWTFWHIPVKFDLAMEYGMRNFIIMFAVLTTKFVLLTIIMTFFWAKLGQTTVIAIVMHGLSNDSVRLGGNVLAEAFIDQLRYEINLALPMFVVAILLTVATRGKLGVNSSEPTGEPTPSTQA